jgi:translation initiation factor 5A
MGDIEDTQFEAADSGASATYPQQCSALRKNGFVMLKGRPCKIVEMSTSKTGKHGHAKVHMVGLDIFTGKKCEDICPSTHNMDVPFVKREDYQLMDISDDGYLTLMSDGGDLREDLKLPDGDLGSQLKAEFDNGREILCTVLKACGEEVVIAIKTNTALEKTN